MPSGKAMLERVESGISGSGIQCHVCSGNLEVCAGLGDGGSVIDCGEGVSTCMLGKSSRFYAMHTYHTR